MKKRQALLWQRAAVRYAFLAAHHDRWPVAGLCEVLEVRRSGFSAYLRRQGAAGEGRDALGRLAPVTAIATQTRHSDGSRRMAKPLQAEGGPVGRAKARRLLQVAGVTVRRPQHRRPMTTDRRPSYGVAPTLLARQWDVAQPDQVWAGALTSVWPAAGWVCVAVLLALWSRKVVGWAMSSHSEAGLVQEASRLALGRRQSAAGLLHHADRGRQDACQADQQLRTDTGLRCRMSRTGDCLDNAVAERFFGSLKRARTAHCQYATRQEARHDVSDDIEMCYNSTRQHAYLGYMSPPAYEGVHQAAELSVRFSLTTTVRGKWGKTQMHSILSPDAE